MDKQLDKEDETCKTAQEESSDENDGNVNEAAEDKNEENDEKVDEQQPEEVCTKFYLLFTWPFLVCYN